MENEPYTGANIYRRLWDELYNYVSTYSAPPFDTTNSVTFKTIQRLMQDSLKREIEACIIKDGI